MDPILEHHFYNIANGKAVQNDDGTLSTVKTVIVDIEGKPTLIPTIWDGEEQPIEVAIDNAVNSEINWPRAYGETAVQQLEEQDAMLHSLKGDDGRLLMSDEYTAEEAQTILDTIQADYEDEESSIGFRDIAKLAVAGGALGLEKLGIDTGPMISGLKERGFALGGLSLGDATKGITTLEGRKMAKKKFQLDPSKADPNGDGNMTQLEMTQAEAAQKAAVEAGEVELDKADEAVGMNCGGMMAPELEYDPISGNEVPLGSTPENVRDDIPAMLSQDEYVLPAHVVKWHGLKHIQEMQMEAEAGLMGLQMEGLIGGEEIEPEEGSEEDIVEDIAEGEEIDDGVETPVVEVEDELDDSEYEEEPEESALPGRVKKQKYAFILS